MVFTVHSNILHFQLSLIIAVQKYTIMSWIFFHQFHQNTHAANLFLNHTWKLKVNTAINATTEHIESNAQRLGDLNQFRGAYFYVQ